MLNLNLLIYAIAGTGIVGTSAAGYYFIFKEDENKPSHSIVIGADTQSNDLNILSSKQEETKNVLKAKTSKLPLLNKDIEDLKNEEEKLTKSINAFSDLAKMDSLDKSQIPTLTTKEKQLKQDKEEKENKAREVQKEFEQKQRLRDVVKNSYDEQVQKQSEAQRKLIEVENKKTCVEETFRAKQKVKQSTDANVKAKKESLIDNKTKLSKSISSLVHASFTALLPNWLNQAIGGDSSPESTQPQDLIKKILEHKKEFENDYSTLKDLESTATTLEAEYQTLNQKLHDEILDMSLKRDEFGKEIDKTAELKKQLEPLQKDFENIERSVNESNEQLSMTATNYQVAWLTLESKEKIIKFYSLNTTELEAKKLELKREKATLTTSEAVVDKTISTLLDDEISKLDSIILLTKSKVPVGGEVLSADTLKASEDALALAKKNLQEKISEITEINSQITDLNGDLSKLTSQIERSSKEITIPEELT